jgi:mannose/fructose-specific phosphotransferase system component IIA
LQKIDFFHDVTSSRLVETPVFANTHDVTSHREVIFIGDFLGNSVAA